MKIRGIGKLFTLSVLLLLSGQALSKCLSSSHKTFQFQYEKDKKIELPQGVDLQKLSIQLLECLSDPDPEIRDDFAFSTLQTWMRDKKLDKETIKLMRSMLILELSKEENDKHGFKKPFIALTLSEVARYDRKDETFSADERARLVDAAVHYMNSIEDYRGFDEKSGWRHGVAHTADLMMQLSLNPEITKAQLDEMLISLQEKIAPSSGHSYHFGESSRLARPVIYIASRKLHSEQEWHTWFLTLATSTPYPTWKDALSKQKGLARKHNLEFFLLSMHANVHQSDDQELKSLLLPGITDAISKLP